MRQKGRPPDAKPLDALDRLALLQRVLDGDVEPRWASRPTASSFQPASAVSTIVFAFYSEGYITPRSAATHPERSRRRRPAARRQRPRGADHRPRRGPLYLTSVHVVEAEPGVDDVCNAVSSTSTASGVPPPPPSSRRLHDVAFPYDRGAARASSTAAAARPWAPPSASLRLGPHLSRHPQTRHHRRPPDRRRRRRRRHGRLEHGIFVPLVIEIWTSPPTCPAATWTPSPESDRQQARASSPPVASATSEILAADADAAAPNPAPADADVTTPTGGHADATQCRFRRRRRQQPRSSPPPTMRETPPASPTHPPPQIFDPAFSSANSPPAQRHTTAALVGLSCPRHTARICVIHHASSRVAHGRPARARANFCPGIIIRSMLRTAREIREGMPTTRQHLIIGFSARFRRRWVDGLSLRQGEKPSSRRRVRCDFFLDAKSARAASSHQGFSEGGLGGQGGGAGDECGVAGALVEHLEALDEAVGAAARVAALESSPGSRGTRSTALARVRRRAGARWLRGERTEVDILTRCAGRSETATCAFPSRRPSRRTRVGRATRRRCGPTREGFSGGRPRLLQPEAA